MATLIVYATKHGTTAEVARRLAAQLDEARLWDLAQGTVDLDTASLVVLGTPIYAGRPLSAMTKFATTVPADKRVGLFVCGMLPDPEKRAEELASAYPAQLRERAAATAFLGGRYQFAAMSVVERFIIKRVAKSSSDVDEIDDAAIARFAAQLKAE